MISGIKERRSKELNYLYFSLALVVLIFIIFRFYHLLSVQVKFDIDAPSRWALLALGLTNALAIGILLFIVARSLVKLYFERRSGVLGAHIRTRLVGALFLIGIVPSLMLFLVGRTFIRKNIDRWFLPNTQQVIRDGYFMIDVFRNQIKQQLQNIILNITKYNLDNEFYLSEAKSYCDLVAIQKAELTPLIYTKNNFTLPRFENLSSGFNIQQLEFGAWFLEVSQPDNNNRRVIVGIFVSRNILDTITRLERRNLESLQLSVGREALETLPQNTFLFLTLLTIFASVWVGLTIANTISEPVRHLAKAAKRVGKGDLDVLLPEDGEDELAMLSRSFNVMTKDLLQNRIDIEKQSKRLEHHNAYLDQLLEALPVGILSWQKDGYLHTFNSTARLWFNINNIDRKTDLTSIWNYLVDSLCTGKLSDLISEVRFSRQSTIREFRIGRESNGRLIRAVVIPLKGGGELAVLEDLSLLAQAEKRAAWQEVARRVAHEIKNPLTPIKLTTQRLLRKSYDGCLDVESVTNGAHIILTEVASLVALVDNFSHFAKLPALQLNSINAVELVTQTMNMFIAAHQNIVWRLEVPTEPLLVLWDYDMVKRALVNLVNNAISAINNKMYNIDKVGKICVSLRDSAGLIFIEVDDNGHGVSEANRSFLFDPYFSTKSNGTGLGLVIVKRAASDHGGEAYYQPLDIGSRFGIKLPSKN